MRYISFLVALLLSTAALAQDPGDVWTYSGPTQGSGWKAPTGGVGSGFCGAAGAIQTTSGVAGGCVPLLPGTGVATFLATPIDGIPATWLKAGVAAANLGFVPAAASRTVTVFPPLEGGGPLAGDLEISLASQSACTILANATAGNAIPTQTGVGAGLACSGGQLVATTTGAGDVAGPASSINNNVVTFDGTSGKLLKDGGKALPTGAILGTTDAQTITNKEIDYTQNTITNLPTSSGSLDITDGTVTVTAATTGSYDPTSFSVTDSGAGVALIKLKTTVRAISTTTGTAIATDANKLLRMTNAGASTLDATAAATLGANFGFWFECDGAAGCTFNPAGSETVDGALTVTFSPGGKAWIQTDGTGWRVFYGSSLDPRNGANLNTASVTKAKLENMNAHTVRCNNTGSAGVPIDCTLAQLNTELNTVRPEYIQVALSDEGTALTTGTGKITFRMPFAMTLTAVRCSLTTASSSGLPTFDLNEGGTTVLSTKVTIDATEKTSVSAVAAAVISDAAIADDAEMSWDIDVAGTGATGAKCTMIGVRT